MCARSLAIPVLLNYLSADRIKAGMATINGNMARQVGKKAISDDRKNALARIKPAEKYDDSRVAIR